MKKIHALLVLGSLLVVGGLLARFYAYPTLAVIPADTDVTVVATSVKDVPATYFSIADLAEVTNPLTSVTRVRANAKLSELAAKETGKDVIVFDVYACTDPSGGDAGGAASKNCLTNKLPISGELSRYAMDQSSGELVDWSGGRVESGGKVSEDVPFAGYVFKLPFNAQPHDYEMWNGGLQDTLPATFVKEMKVAGVRTYEYRTEMAPTVVGQLELPGSLVGSDEPTVSADQVASSSGVLLVEPETGLIVGGSSTLDSYAELDGKRVLTISSGTFAVSDEEVAKGAKDAAKTATGLKLLRVTGPVVAVALGLLILALALVLLVRRRRRTRDAAVPDHGDDHRATGNQRRGRKRDQRVVEVAR